MSLIRKYLTASASGLLAKGTTIFGALGILWLANQILDKDGFGLFMLAFTCMIMLAAIIASPFLALILYRIAPLEEHGGTNADARNMAGKTLYGGLLAGFVCAGILALSAPLIAQAMHKPDLALWLIWLSPMLPLDIGRLCLTNWYRARQQVARSVYYQETLPNILRCAFLAMVWLWPDIHALYGVVAAMIAAQLIPLVWLYARDPVLPQLGKRAFPRGDITYSFKNMAAQLVSEPTRSFDLLFLGAVVTAAQAADYALAARLSRLLLVPRQALAQLLVPRFAALLAQDNKDKLLAEYDAIRTASLLLALIGTTGLLLIGPWLLALFGDYRSAFPVLILLAYAQVLVCGFGNASGLLGVSGHAIWVMYTGILGTLMVLGGGVLLAMQYGAAGMAVAVIIAMTLLYGLLFIPCQRFLQLKTMHSAVWLVLLATGLVCILAAFMPQYHLWLALGMCLISAVYATLDRSVMRFYRLHKGG